MTEKAKAMIDLGCEPGSEECRGCAYLIRRRDTGEFPADCYCTFFGNTDGGDGKRRHTKCLAGEREARELREEVAVALKALDLACDNLGDNNNPYSNSPERYLGEAGALLGDYFHNCANCEKLKSENATLRAKLEELQAENVGLAKALDRIAYALSDAAKVLEPTPVKDTTGTCPLPVLEDVLDTTLTPELTGGARLRLEAIANLWTCKIKEEDTQELIEKGMIDPVYHTLTPAGREAVERRRK